MYLLDTVALSELRRRRRNPGFERWFAEQRDDDLFLSVITIGEVERGVAQERQRGSAFADALEIWRDGVVDAFGDRILPVNQAIARHWGRLGARLGNSSADLLIAATAAVHGLTVVTRNVRHFIPAGVRVENPFEAG
jgi:predicted nucleic acid-binding protein